LSYGRGCHSLPALRPNRRYPSTPPPADATFRIRNCALPEAGLYWVELVYSGSVLARRPTWLYA